MKLLKIIKKNKLLILSVLLLLFIIYNSLVKTTRETLIHYNDKTKEYVDLLVKGFKKNKSSVIQVVNQVHDNVLNKSKPEKEKINNLFFEFADNNPDTMNNIDEILEEILSNIVNKKKFLKKTRTKLLEFLED